MRAEKEQTLTGATGISSKQMMRRTPQQAGFTLLEIMVVVFIVAIMSGLSFFALNQATDRRYTSQAEDFRLWLQQLSDMALLEGTAYGLSYGENSLEALVYYNYAWYRVSTPQAFSFRDEVSLSLTEERGQVSRQFRQRNTERRNLPDLVMSSDGFMQPESDLALNFSDFRPAFKYRQDSNGINLILEREL